MNMDENSEGIILFADDDAQILEIHQKNLNKHFPNYQIECFSDGNSLKKRLEGKLDGVKVVLTDNNMPGISGREIIAYCFEKKEFENISFILFSTCDDDIVEEVEDKYRAKYLPKNVDICYLVEVVKQAVEKPARGEGI